MVSQIFLFVHEYYIESYELWTHFYGSSTLLFVGQIIIALYFIFVFLPDERYDNHMRNDH